MPRQNVTKHSATVRGVTRRKQIKNGNDVYAARNRDKTLNQQHVTRARGASFQKQREKCRRDKTHTRKINKCASHTRAIRKHDTKSKHPQRQSAKNTDRLLIRLANHCRLILRSTRMPFCFANGRIPSVGCFIRQTDSRPASSRRRESRVCTRTCPALRRSCSCRGPCTDSCTAAASSPRRRTADCTGTPAYCQC